MTQAARETKAQRVERLKREKNPLESLKEIRRSRARDTLTTRNAMIGFVVLGYAIYWASAGQALTISNKASSLWQKFPKFVLGANRFFGCDHDKPICG